MNDNNIKDTIVKAATKYFSKYGFYRTTMEEIAKHIHKAKGLIYYYFKSKEELFREVLKLELENVKSELSQIARKKSDSLTMLETYIIKRMKLLSKAYNYHETLKADFFEKYHFVKDVRDDFYEFELNQITCILDKSVKEGFLEIKNTAKTVNIIMMIITSIEIPLFLQNKYAEYEDTLKDMALMVLGSIRNQKTK